MFPPAGANIYTNEAGEPLGWDMPEVPEDYYCGECGTVHAGDCPDYYRDDNDDLEEHAEHWDRGEPVVGCSACEAIGDGIWRERYAETH